jgi:GNAT superfamily N-acetyltransferase
MTRELGDAPTPAYLARCARWFRGELRTRRLLGLLAVTRDDVPVASGLMWLQPRYPSRHFPQLETPIVFSVYTAPAHRRRGLASRIVLGLAAAAQRRGYTRVELFSSKMGRPVYEAIGFRPTEQLRLDLTARPKADLGRRGG